MRLSATCPALLSLFALFPSTIAKPHPRDIPFGEINGAHALEKRCSNPCGWTGQLCCAADQTCFTDSAGRAQCGTGGNSGGNNNGGQATAAATAQGGSGTGGGTWQYFTTTYVETDLVTHVSTYSSMVGGGQATVAAAPTQTAQSSCSWGQTPCGSICCASNQYCAVAGQCAAGSHQGGSSSYSSYMTSQPYSVPLRPTTGGATTATSTASASTTVPFQTPTGTAGGIVYGTTGMEQTNNGGLSGGAIAGIVIGVVAGIILLFLICFCCCLRAGWDGLMGILGLRSRRRRETEETYIHESHHHGGGGGGGGGGAAAVGGSRPWFGGRPARADRPPKKNSGFFSGLGPVAAGLGGLALALGLKRRHDRRNEEKYSGSGSSYSYYDTSESSASSDDRRTRTSRHSRR